MHDPDTLILSIGPFSLWHQDPCNKPGCGDDSCGWFMRASHGKKKVLEEIIKRIDFDFDRTWTSDLQHTYHCGLFCPNGDPHFSVQGVVLNMFYSAAWCYFKDKHGSTDAAWRKSRQWMQNNLFQILIFAENPTDSLFDEITGKFRIACGEEWNRDKALSVYASCIYGWILREQRPWWKHPRWHVYHWRISCRPFWRKSDTCCAVEVAR